MMTLAMVLALIVGLGACGGRKATPTAVPKQWAEPPAMQIDPNKIYAARLSTEKGDIVIELLARQAPITVNNFVFLARQGFYDGTTFHRVIPDFMAQGGDPTGTGAGGPGYRFQDEIRPESRFDGPGYLAMANAGPNTNGSQFFITYAATPWLDGKHTIFGKVVEGMDVALSLTPRDPQQATKPGDRLDRVTVEEWSGSRLPAK
jgi:cyclophilin family peptidyl-prolyl cis-trans isomerase